MQNLIQQIVAWAQVAYNWLKNFFKIIWGVIQSYWPHVKEYVKELLREAIEVIILDGREEKGRELIEILKQNHPIDIDDINELVTLAVNSDKSIKKISDLEANVQQQDQYDTMASQNNGVIRING